MAEITKVGTPSISGLHPHLNHLPSLVAGEALGAGDACYIKASDGKVYKSTGAADTEPARVHGYAPKATKAGQQVTLYYNVRFQYATALTPGAKVYLSGTVAGGLADAASTGGTAPIGFCVDAKRIELFPSMY